MPAQRVTCGASSFDPRSLAAFRIAIGALVLWDLALRATNFAAHYGERGVLPPELVPLHFAHRYLPASFGWGDPYSIFLFAAAAMAALALVVGYRTRLATLMLWYLLLAIHARNPLVLSGGDVLLVLILLWSIFLPLGLVWSLDYRRRAGGKPAIAPAIERMAAVVLGFQVLATVFFSGLAKLGSAAWTTDANAMAYALHLRATAIGARLLAMPEGALSAFTRAALVVEIGGPILLLAVWYFPRLRLAVLALIGAMLAVIALSLNVGILPVVTLAGLLIFVPSGVWHSEAVAPSNTACMRAPSGVVAAVSTLWLLHTIISFNARTLTTAPDRFPVIAAPIGRALGLDYRWAMFASLGQDVSWIVLRGERAGWAAIELTGAMRGEVAPAVPLRRRFGVWEYRWLRYEESLLGAGNALRERYAKYFCETFEREHPGDHTFDSVALYLGRQRLLAGNELGPVRMELLLSVPCRA